MSEKLYNKDYVNILNNYHRPIPKSKKEIKIKAEKKMAQKLCQCIKKINSKLEAKSIGICTRQIFNKRGYTRGKFQCKAKRFVEFRRTVKNKNKSKNKTRKR
jgi:hypothetical protein